MSFSPQQEHARAWRWPRHLHDVADILRATNAGFLLVDWIEPRSGRPIARLMRDGEYSPPGLVSSHAAHSARQKYFRIKERLPDETLVYERKPETIRKGDPNARS